MSYLRFKKSIFYFFNDSVKNEPSLITLVRRILTKFGISVCVIRHIP